MKNLIFFIKILRFFFVIDFFYYFEVRPFSSEHRLQVFPSSSQALSLLSVFTEKQQEYKVVPDE